MPLGGGQTTILDWLLDQVDTNLDQLKNDPEALVAASTLSQAQKEVLLSGDHKRIRRVIELESGTAAFESRIWVFLSPTPGT